MRVMVAVSVDTAPNSAYTNKYMVQSGVYCHNPNSITKQHHANSVVASRSVKKHNMKHKYNNTTTVAEIMMMTNSLKMIGS